MIIVTLGIYSYTRGYCLEPDEVDDSDLPSHVSHKYTVV
jgi:hypothetical protein